jgi:hypothetical protein
MKTSQQAVAIVTGAASGIGLGVTQALLQRGWRVVATSRTISKSKELKPSHDLSSWMETSARGKPPSGIGNRCHKLRPSEIRPHRGDHYWSSDSKAFTKSSLQHPTNLNSFASEKSRLTNHTHDRELLAVVVPET